MKKNRIERFYGDNKRIGDIMLDTTTNTIWTQIDLGVFEPLSLIFIKINGSDTFKMYKKYKDNNGMEQNKQIGKTFEVRNKQGDIVKGLSKGTISMSKQYNKEDRKTYNVNNNGIFFTTFMLDTPEEKKEGLLKVGYIKGQIGIEKPNVKE